VSAQLGLPTPTRSASASRIIAYSEFAGTSSASERRVERRPIESSSDGCRPARASLLDSLLRQDAGAAEVMANEWVSYEPSLTRTTIGGVGGGQGILFAAATGVMMGGSTPHKDGAAVAW
jgi:hypothetical protein